MEVKTRRSRDFSDPLAAIDHRKLGNLQRAINHYVRSHRIEHYRFDIVTVVGELHSPAPDVRHYEDINIMEMAGNPSYKRARN